MPTRPPVQPLPSSSSSSIQQRQQHHYDPSIPLYKLFSNLTFHIITAKLENELTKIYSCIDELGGKSVRIEDCKLIISAIKGKPRLIRSLGEWFDKKTILTPEYISDAYTNALTYATQIDPLHPPKLPDRSKYIISHGLRIVTPIFHSPIYVKREIRDVKLEEEAEEEEDMRPPMKKRKIAQQEIDEKPGIKPQINHDGHDKNSSAQLDLMSDMTLVSEDTKFEDIPALCIHRGSPLKCVNQNMLDAIRPIFEEREFEENQQKNSNVLSYRRSLSVTVPRPIRSGKEAMKLLGVGDKVAQRVDEYLQTGKIEESFKILSSSRFQSLKLFSSVYTIGNFKAKELYDNHYCRTLADVKNHFEAIEEESPEVRLKDKLRRRRKGRMKQVEIVEEWIKLKDELDQKIPREEVEEIAACVMEHLDAYVPGCQYTICGGYRRGKSESNDVDIVFAPPGVDQDIGLLRDLYMRMSDLGIITHVLHVTHRDANTPIHASSQNFDNLDKAFVILKLPGPGRLHRRVDLISSPADRYSAAVLSWSGSMMFERDLKRYTENVRGFKFRAGLLEMSTGDEVYLETERDIFQFLGLRYVPPELRNAD
ncbi:uncharacterized protein L201_004064 [Kwoniella dendrophila CBS 6074]|uniref:DNA polymerase n=1 Tax=Kwoniella dendrophila CBS 6074 TaxID=1295534 RepID=A0AAX4JUN4_9TREE